MLIAHKLALEGKTLRDFFHNNIYDEVIDDFEFEVVSMREFTDIAKNEFKLSEPNL